jgi:signal transduction histidine kinase
MFHGLPSSNVRAIAQDHDGILWFGTDSGLVRYDGVRLERVVLEPSSVGVHSLAVDSKGRLWVGTDAGALLRRPQGTLPVPRTEGHRILAILPDAEGVVWLSSDQGAVFTCTSRDDGALDVTRLGPEQSERLRPRGQAALALPALGRRGSTALVGTRGRGLLSVRAAEVTEATDPPGPFFVTAMIGDDAGRVFLGTETSGAGRGVFELREKRASALDVRTGPVSALALDVRGGDLWVGTRANGLFRIRAGRALENLTLGNTGGGLHSNRVLALFADRDGVVWVGTDRGVCRYDPRGPRQQRIGATPDSNFVHALLPDADGRLWAGTQGGLFVREEADGGWRRVEAIGPRAVHALGKTEDGHLLVGSANGLQVQDPDAGDDQQRWRTFEAQASAPEIGQSVRAIRLLGGVVYLATFGRGVERLAGEERSLIWPAADDDAALREVVSLSVANDELWVGTSRSGAFAVRGEHAIRHPELSDVGTLRSVVADGRDGLWVGTDQGLFRLAQGRLESVLPGQDVRALVPEKGSALAVWCGTTRSGVIKVSFEPQLGAMTSRLGTDYGLPSESVFAMTAVEGSNSERVLVLGTNRGIASYKPGRVPPSLRLVRVLGRRPYPTEEWHRLVLEYPQNSLLVQAAAVGSRTYPEHFQYLFTLSTSDGRSLDSTLARDGQYVAESLAPGQYRIEARAFGTDLLASEPVTLGFDVARAPIPWPSVALGGLLICALLALGWGYRQNRGLVRANRAVSEARLQLAQETETERRRIARDLHDQTLADLRRILLMISGPNSPSTMDGPLRSGIEAISTEVRRICEDLSPSVLENVGLTAALQWALDQTVQHLPSDHACKITFLCEDSVESRLSLNASVQIQIYRIVQEALTNASKHARPSEVRMGVHLGEDGVLEIVVEDDGSGFDAGLVPKGRGLMNIRSRAGLIGATVEWRARPGTGTIFVLRRAASDQTTTGKHHGSSPGV